MGGTCLYTEGGDLRPSLSESLLTSLLLTSLMLASPGFIWACKASFSAWRCPLDSIKIPCSAANELFPSLPGS